MLMAVMPYVWLGLMCYGHGWPVCALIDGLVLHAESVRDNPSHEALGCLCRLLCDCDILWWLVE